jgi:formate--tetrahydrofolate ligase
VFPDDPPDELQWVTAHALTLGAAGAAISTHYRDGSAGAEELAREVMRVCQQPSDFHPLYAETDTIKQKIETIATRMYGAGSVIYHEHAEHQIEQATRLGLSNLPICMAKTPLSLSHDPKLVGRPTGFALPIKELRFLAGAGFVTAVCSGIQLMPGLPKHPAGERLRVDPESGAIEGLV